MNSKAKSTFEVLSAINVNEHTQSKMNLTYLSWSWAWGELLSQYPKSSYEFLTPITYSDGSMEVSVDVTVEGVTRNMLLPVMDHRNKAIKAPNARDISDARMRCLVKCIAMFGLGLYIYAGEAIPETEKELVNKAASDLFRHGENRDIAGAKEVWGELSQEDKKLVWAKLPSDARPGITELLS